MNTETEKFSVPLITTGNTNSHLKQYATLGATCTTSHSSDGQQSNDLSGNWYNQITSESGSIIVSIVGRPNVGKSTLINAISQKKISIVCVKPQTTRHRIESVKTLRDKRIIYVDTPGAHDIYGFAQHGTYNKKKRNIGRGSILRKMMNKTARSAMFDAGILLFVVDQLKFYEEDQHVLDGIITCNKPTILIVNKVDKIRDKNQLLPFMDEMNKKFDFQSIIPISAINGTNLDALESEIRKIILSQPEVSSVGLGKSCKAEESLNCKKESEEANENNNPIVENIKNIDSALKFFITEILREKLISLLRDEVPYSIAVVLNEIRSGQKRKDRNEVATRINNKNNKNRSSVAANSNVVFLDATIFVEKFNHKAIVIGENGKMIKAVGQQARKELEELFNKKIFLNLWVEVQEGWTNNEQQVFKLVYQI